MKSAVCRITPLLWIGALMVSHGVGPSQGPEQGKKAVDVHGDSLPEGALARMGTIRWRHAGPVFYVAFPPDPSTVLTAGRDDVIRLWERNSGKEIRRFSIPAMTGPGGLRQNPDFSPASVTLSPDGKLLAALSRDKEVICLWDLASGKELRQISSRVLDKLGLSNGHAVVFSPDSKILAMRMITRDVRLFDPYTGLPIRHIKFEPRKPGQGIAFVSGGEGGGIAFSPDSETLATVESEPGQSYYVRLVSVATGKTCCVVDSAKRVSGLAFSSDAKHLAYGTFKMIHLCSPENGKELRQIKSNMTTTKLLCFSPDGKTLAAKGIDLSIEIFDIPSAATLGKVREPVADAEMGYIPGTDEGRDLTFSPDGKTIAAGDRNTVRIWQAPLRP